MISELLKPFASVLLAEAIRRLQHSDTSFKYKHESLQNTVNNVQQLMKQPNVVSIDHLLNVEKLAYKANDLVDDILISNFRRQGWVRKVWYLLPNFLLERKVDSIQVKFDDLLKRINLFHGLLSSASQPTLVGVAKPESTSLLSPKVFGRENDLTELIAMSTSTQDGVSVTPIVGMIGVGKTTLAQLLFNHDGYEEPFDVKIWVFAQRDSNAEILLGHAIQNAVYLTTEGHYEPKPDNNTFSKSGFTLENLHQKLSKILRGKKFLLIFDDLQKMEKSYWDVSLLPPLQTGLKGSKIIITTRNNTFSNQVRTTKQYDLEILSDSDCWSLLKYKALPEEIHMSPQLEKIGEEIARSCKGLPLVAKRIGELLHSMSQTMEWDPRSMETMWDNFLKKILQGNMWGSSDIREVTDPFLIAGYSHLSATLRQCISFCSMFPQGHIYQKAKIIQMWMGQELPETKNGSGLFQELLSNAFFQNDGEKYIIHEVLHELLQSIFAMKFLRTDGENLLGSESAMHISESGGDGKNLLGSESTMHISVSGDKIEALISKAYMKWEGLRTVLLIDGAYEKHITRLPLDLFKLKSLRVLDLSGTDLEELAKDITHLRHLRFLDLSNTRLKEIPDLMQKLCVLQTLRLIRCENLLCLPAKIGKCKSLLHLELDKENKKISSMPLKIGKLTDLQTLNVFFVGEKGSQLRELKNMNKLRGSLCIKNLENVRRIAEATKADLAKKIDINELELQWATTVEADHAKDILGKLIAPSESLESLTLRKYSGTVFPGWVSCRMFSKLTSIVLDECVNCTLLPALGNLPALKFLKIKDMPHLLTVEQSFLGDDNNTRFKSLKTLEFSNMPRLINWSVIGVNDMSCLHKLIFDQCPVLARLPWLGNQRALKTLELHDCPMLTKLSVVILPGVKLIRSGREMLDKVYFRSATI